MNRRLSILFVALCLAMSPSLFADAIDFEKQIKPLLEKHCVECHGKDKQKGGLLLTSRKAALTDTDAGYPAIVPGDAEDSEFYLRLMTDDKDERMPPKGDRLTDDQVKLMKKWIMTGAVWPDDGSEKTHWAYVAPKRPEVPASKWGRNEIDSFIAAKLKEVGLTHSEEAEARKLLRRVYLDIIGLPPTPAQVSEYMTAHKVDPERAYAKLVDQLLASPRFGEKWARHWLDLARYADSNGFQADQLREIWAYRDWVIKAFNDNKPFDEFTIEQIAGDLLPNATSDQKIATGFHRTVTCNVEAGVHPEENRNNQVFDRVNTTGIVWLGTTMECAQCHNHKYDPITQKEYYQMFAYFNNTPLEVKQGAGVRYDLVGPKMSLPVDDEIKAKLVTMNGRLAELEQAFKKLSAKSEKYKDWKQRTLDSLNQKTDWQAQKPYVFDSTGGEDHEILEDDSVLVSGNLPGTSIYTITFKTQMAGINSLRIEALSDESLPGKGPGRGDAKRPNFILSEVELSMTDASNQEKTVKLSGAKADYEQKKWHAKSAIDGNRQTGWAIGQAFGKSHWIKLDLEQPINQDGGEVTLKLTLDQNYGRGRTIGRVRVSLFNGDTDASDLPARIVTLLKKKGKLPSKENRELMKYFEQSNPELMKLKRQKETLQQQIKQVEPPTTLVMVEMDKPRETHILRRGEYLNKGLKVSYGTPGTLHPLAKDAPKNRLGFAQWLVDEKNPLVARVTVNRLWAQIMGQGLVKSQEDFGSQAEDPTHPKLLDWLAVEFMSSGWDMKRIIRKIVSSATYRQRSHITPEGLEKDPLNQWYARGARFRLSAEAIRDVNLAVSGQLSTRMYGKPIMPYQPDNIWRQVGRNEPKWVEAKDENRFRRGVYVVWRRAAPYPSFVNFDAPDRAACVPNRGRTNTPLQALTLMNDQAYVEMALALATRILEKAGSDEERLAYAFSRVLTREPNHSEAATLKNILDVERDSAAANPEKCSTILKSIKGVTPPKSIDPVALVTWFKVATVLINLDENINKG